MRRCCSHLLYCVLERQLSLSIQQRFSRRQLSRQPPALRHVSAQTPISSTNRARSRSSSNRGSSINPIGGDGSKGEDSARVQELAGAAKVKAQEEEVPEFAPSPCLEFKLDDCVATVWVSSTTRSGLGSTLRGDGTGLVPHNEARINLALLTLCADWAMMAAGRLLQCKGFWAAAGLQRRCWLAAIGQTQLAATRLVGLQLQDERIAQRQGSVSAPPPPSAAHERAAPTCGCESDGAGAAGGWG